MIDADVLEHADRDDAVERTFDVAVVLQLEATVGARPFSAARSLAMRVLLLRQRHASDLGAGDLGEIEREPAPAAADVEHALARGSSSSLAARWRFLASWASSSDCSGFSK